MSAHTVATIFGQRIRNEGTGIGIEIEVEGARLLGEGERISGWNITTDGSLRGEAYEYVLKGPMPIEGAKAALKNLEKALQDNGAYVASAHRGSTHIHVNVQTKTLEQVFTTLYLWMIVEPLWLHMCGPQRDGNLFCLPSYLSGDMTFFAETLLQAHREGANWNIIHRGKYSALNTDCLANFGSLEFRTFASQTDSSVVSNWVDWCQNLVTLGTDIEIKDMHRVADAAMNDPRGFCTRIFQMDLPFSDPDLACILEQGVSSASPMILVGAKHLALSPKKKAA